MTVGKMYVERGERVLVGKRATRKDRSHMGRKYDTHYKVLKLDTEESFHVKPKLIVRQWFHRTRWLL